MAAPSLTDASGSVCWIADRGTTAPPRPSDVVTMSYTLDSLLLAELDGAQDAMGCSAEEILLAALGRTIARTVGNGVLVVDVIDDGGQRRVAVTCVARRDLSGSELLAAACSSAGSEATYPRADVSLGYATTARVAGHHPLAVRVLPVSAEELRVEWSFDARRFDHYTVEEMAEQFPLALIEVTSG